MEALFEGFGDMKESLDVAGDYDSKDQQSYEGTTGGLLQDQWASSLLNSSSFTSGFGSSALSGAPGLHTTTPPYPFFTSKMGELTRILRNDLHSPPPIEREPQPSWGFPKMELGLTPPPPKSRKSLKNSNRSHSRTSSKTNLDNGSLLRTPQPMKRPAPITLLRREPDHSTEYLFDRPISPPICESPPLSHNPVFKANAEFFDKLKAHFFTESRWCQEVGDILESKRRNGFVFMVLERIVAPPEYFYSWCVEFFFQHHPTNLNEFLNRMKGLMQGIWDERLYKYVESFYNVATSLSQKSGVGDSCRTPTTKGSEIYNVKLDTVRQSSKSQAEAVSTPKRTRRSTRSASKKRRYFEDLQRFEKVRQILLREFTRREGKRRKIPQKSPENATSTSADTTNISSLLA